MNRKKNDRHFLEKIIFAFGSLMLLGLVVYLVFQIRNQNSLLPNLIVRQTPEKGAEFITYKIAIENMGEGTAENANINLDLYENGEVIETSTIVLDFVPPLSEETSWIVFYGRTKQGDSLIVSSITYKKP